MAINNILVFYWRTADELRCDLPVKTSLSFVLEVSVSGLVSFFDVLVMTQSLMVVRIPG